MTTATEHLAEVLKIGRAAELSRIRQVHIDRIYPSPENDKLYRPVDMDDPDIRAMAASIEVDGVKEPLVLTLDYFILSGHRRHAAANVACETTVPCRFEPIYRGDGTGDEFLSALRTYNMQRVKSNAEILRENVMAANPDHEYRALIEHRKNSALVACEPMSLSASRKRKKISKAKDELLAAVKKVIEDMREHWPLTDRQIHYQLLNNPPLTHSSKDDSRYENTQKCYKNQLVDILTRGRLAGEIPWEAIADETRSVEVWDVHAHTGPFIRQELDQFLKGYCRDLLQSQPNHIEIVGEKNTVKSILRPIASEYCIPMTTGRGYCSLPPRKAMADRFIKSGKEKLIILEVSDFDPDGEQIAESFVKSMRDEFYIDNEVVGYKVALTADHVRRFNLPPVMQAKKTSVNYQKFSAKFGDDVHELESLQPQQLVSIVRESVDRILDVDAFNAEIEKEKTDAAYLAGVRKTLQDAMKRAS